MNDCEFQLECSLEPVRGDHELYCPRKGRTVLVIDGTCLSRLRNYGCSGCVCDQKNFILSKLIWLMLDICEDRADEQRRPSKTCIR
jgi:hypothetical protein